MEKDLMARMKEIEEEEKALSTKPLSKEGGGLSHQVEHETETE